LPSASQLDHLRVVLVSTRNPLNIGAAARAMSNFGFARLRVVNPFQPAFREAKSAVGGANVLGDAELFKSVAEAVADCALVVGTSAVGKRNMHHPLRRLEEGAKLIRRRIASGGKVALLFGSEKRGLTNDELSHCHWVMRAPTVDANISMNLGQAVAVCLYEIIRAAKLPRTSEKPELATAAEIERITTLLLESLHLSGFTSLRRVADSDERIRRLVRRLHLPARDAVIWQGMFRQIAWKLQHPEAAASPTTSAKP
jgi:TrmH family RNA methyltransferase